MYEIVIATKWTLAVQKLKTHDCCDAHVYHLLDILNAQMISALCFPGGRGGADFSFWIFLCRQPHCRFCWIELINSF